MARTKIKGKSLSLLIDSVEYNCDATSISLLNEEADDADATTFCESSAGAAVSWFIDLTAVSSFDTESLWNYLWDNAGTTGVAFVFAPTGSLTATATEPHFTGTVTLPSKPSIGGDPSASWTYDVRLEVEGEPTKEIA